MRGKGTRASATARRRRAILDAALECFSTLGYERTTMGDIRRRAQASTGSIYHHFTSKEQLAAELYLEGVRETQRAGLAALLGHRGAARGIRAVVQAYLDWVYANPDLASFLLHHRRAEFMLVADRTLEKMNSELRERVSARLRPYVRRRILPDFEEEKYWALLTGPSEFLARRWLHRGRKGDLRRAARDLGDAAWLGLRALAGTRSRPPLTRTIL